MLVPSNKTEKSQHQFILFNLLKKPSILYCFSPFGTKPNHFYSSHEKVIKWPNIRSDRLTNQMLSRENPRVFSLIPRDNSFDLKCCQFLLMPDKFLSLKPWPQHPMHGLSLCFSWKLSTWRLAATKNWYERDGSKGKMDAVNVTEH